MHFDTTQIPWDKRVSVRPGHKEDNVSISSDSNAPGARGEALPPGWSRGPGLVARSLSSEGDSSSGEPIASPLPGYPSKDRFNGFWSHMGDKKRRAALRIIELKQSLQARGTAYLAGNTEGLTGRPSAGSRLGTPTVSAKPRGSMWASEQPWSTRNHGQAAHPPPPPTMGNDRLQIK